MEATTITLHFSAKRRCIVYVPWLSLISFLIVLAGTITCGVGMHSALANTGDLLSRLLIDVRPYTATLQSVAILTVVLCGTLAAAMLLVSCGRSWTEFAVDRRGKVVRGLPVWLSVSATLTVLWYLVLVLLAFLFFLSAIWYGVTYSSTGILRVSMRYALRTAEQIKRADAQIDQALRPAPLPPTSMPSPAPSGYSGVESYNTTGGFQQADSGNTTSCPSDCLSLAFLEYVVQKRPCICMLVSLQEAHGYAKAAHNSVATLLVGSCLLWVGASFLLMTATAEFAVARRERALLLRAQAAAAAARQPLDPRSGSDSPATHKQLQEQQLQQLLVQHGAAAAGGAVGVQSYLVSEADNVPLLKEQGGQQQYANYQEKPYEEQPYQEYPYQEQPYQDQPYQHQQPYVEMSYQQQQSYRVQPYQGHSATVVATSAVDGGGLNGGGRS